LEQFKLEQEKDPKFTFTETTKPEGDTIKDIVYNIFSTEFFMFLRSDFALDLNFFSKLFLLDLVF